MRMWHVSSVCTLLRHVAPYIIIVSDALSSSDEYIVLGLSIFLHVQLAVWVLGPSFAGMQMKKSIWKTNVYKTKFD